jgi:superfamily II DNA/RNA helicase
VAPTRELAEQIVDEIRGIAHARSRSHRLQGVGIEAQARKATRPTSSSPPGAGV